MELSEHPKPLLSSCQCLLMGCCLSLCVWDQEEGQDANSGKETAGNVLGTNWAPCLFSPHSQSWTFFLSQLGSLTYSHHYHIRRQFLSRGKNSLCDLGGKQEP